MAAPGDRGQCCAQQLPSASKPGSMDRPRTATLLALFAGELDGGAVRRAFAAEPSVDLNSACRVGVIEVELDDERLAHRDVDVPAGQVVCDGRLACHRREVFLLQPTSERSSTSMFVLDDNLSLQLPGDNVTTSPSRLLGCRRFCLPPTKMRPVSRTGGVGERRRPTGKGRATLPRRSRAGGEVLAQGSSRRSALDARLLELTLDHFADVLRLSASLCSWVRYSLMLSGSRWACVPRRERLASSVAALSRSSNDGNRRAHIATLGTGVTSTSTPPRHGRHPCGDQRFSSRFCGDFDPGVLGLERGALRRGPNRGPSPDLGATTSSSPPGRRAAVSCAWRTGIPRANLAEAERA